MSLPWLIVYYFGAGILSVGLFAVLFQKIMEDGEGWTPKVMFWVVIFIVTWPIWLAAVIGIAILAFLSQ